MPVAVCQRAMPSVSVHFRMTPAGTAHSAAMPASAPARLPVRISPAPTLVAVSRIAGPIAESRLGCATEIEDTNLSAFRQLLIASSGIHGGDARGILRRVRHASELAIPAISSASRHRFSSGQFALERMVLSRRAECGRPTLNGARDRERDVAAVALEHDSRAPIVLLVADDDTFLGSALADSRSVSVRSPTIGPLSA